MEWLWNIRFTVAYLMHVVLSEDMYVWEWKRWMYELHEIKKRELEELKRLR